MNFQLSKHTGPHTNHLLHTADQCTNCGACANHCAFLKQVGTPGELANALIQGEQTEHLAFDCSLCGLCTSVCPQSLNPQQMFLQLRREVTTEEAVNLQPYSGLLHYERWGSSGLFRNVSINKHTTTVFFPGCTLPGTRPNATWQAFQHVRASVPGMENMGLALDCCHKPSHDLGRQEHFLTKMEQLESRLMAQGVENIVVACPNCFKVFNTYSNLNLISLYELLASAPLPRHENLNQTVTIHDPCPLREETQIHEAVRQIVEQLGLSIEEMPHNREKTLCCGEGGAVECINRPLSEKWAGKRVKEADGRHMVTYCAGCAGRLGTATPTSHLLNILFNPNTPLAERTKTAKAPVTYLNRLLLKRKSAKLTRE